MTADDLAIGLDIGGTKIAGGIVDGSGAVLDCVRRETPGHAVGAVEVAILEIVEDIIRSYFKKLFIKNMNEIISLVLL